MKRLGIVAFVLSLLVCCGTASAARIWPITNTSLVTDGPVYNLTSTGDNVFATGDFDEIGRFNGSGLAMNVQTGAVVPNLPAVNGQISYVLANPNGGWYIAGDFTEIGGIPRDGLAEINADGSLNLAFTPSANGLVDALAIDGNSVYLGGSMTTVDGAPREGLAAVDATTGALLPFNPREAGTATELCFEPASNGNPAILYAGMGAVLALDPTTGNPIPTFHSNIEDTIDALAVGDGHLYIGGAGGLVAVDPITGVQDGAFNATPVTLSGASDFTGQVDAIDVEPTRILVGGTFNALGGATGPLVALDPDTGAANTTFRSQVVGSVYDMDQIGNDVWLGGDFTSAGSEYADNIAVVDGTDGSRVNVTLPDINGQVNGIRISGGEVFAGGEFYLVNPLHVSGFAEIQGSTGALNGSFFAAHPRYDSLLSDSDALVSAPLQFQGYDPGKHSQAFHISLTQVQVLDPKNGGVRKAASKVVKNLSGVALAGNDVYTAARIGYKQRFPQNEIVVRSATTGAVLHHYMLPLRGYVSYMLMYRGTLFVAGSFKRTRANGQKANLAILAINPSTGKLYSQFDPHANGPVYSLAAQAAVYSATLYYSGLFDRVGEGIDKRHGIAAVTVGEDYENRDDSSDNSFDPRLSGNSSTLLTALPSDLYVQTGYGQQFLQYSGGALDPFLTADGLRPIDVTSATPLPSEDFISGEFLTPLAAGYEDDLYFLRPVSHS